MTKFQRGDFVLIQSNYDPEYWAPAWVYDPENTSGDLTIRYHDMDRGLERLPPVFTIKKIPPPCLHCNELMVYHAEGKCLFQSSNYAPSPLPEVPCKKTFK